MQNIDIDELAGELVGTQTRIEDVRVIDLDDNPLVSEKELEPPVSKPLTLTIEQWKTLHSKVHTCAVCRTWDYAGNLIFMSIGTVVCKDCLTVNMVG